MRCVNEIFPPRARFRWLLMTMRLSIISFAGTVRTLVAVGTVRLASMLVATAFAMPLSVVTTSVGSTGSWEAGAGTAVGAAAGVGAGFAWSDVVLAIGWLPVGVGTSALAAAGAAGAGAAGAASATGASGAAGVSATSAG